MVAANSAGYFGSDFGCKSANRYMDCNVGLDRLLALGSTRCMCTDTEFD